jgi:hypothetical protein
MAKLIEGFIPPRTICPFKNICQLSVICKHMGKQHTVQFSCAYARVLDKKESGEFVSVRAKKEQPQDLMWLDPNCRVVRPND